MQEGYNKPSFGIFLVRVIILSLALFLLGFIIWGAFKLADDSGVWSTILRVAIVIGFIGLIVMSVRFLLRFLAVNSITLNFARILGIILGVIVIGLIAWGVFRLAVTSSDDEYAEVVSVEDENNSTITLDSTDSSESSESSQSEETGEATGNENQDEATTPEPDSATNNESDPAPATPPPVTTPSDTPNTGPTSTTEDLPNTGIETSILSLISIGVLAYVVKSYHLSRKQLDQF